MEARYLVSVIIATYRRDSELKRALESLISQTYQQIEVIVVDDNANDEWNSKVAAIIKTLKEKANFPIVHIINSTNLGSARTRNKGIENSNGDYITFLDDDDCYLENKIEAQLKDMIENNADYGITDLFLYNSNDKLIDKRVRSYIKDYSMQSLLKYHMMEHMTGTDTLMFKKEFLDKINGFDEIEIDIGDEYYLMEKAILSGGKLKYSPHCYVKAYVHQGDESGLSSGIGKVNGENRLFEEKRKYFYLLNKKEKRQIKMRHYAVIAFAKYRMRKYVSFVVSAMISFLIDPFALLNMLLKHK